MQYGCGSRRAPREVIFSASFSCRYSIYISLLKTFVKHFGNLFEKFWKTLGLGHPFVPVFRSSHDQTPFSSF